MPRRIDVELTSERPDGTWTWRAAGAREPRGELTGALLPTTAKVGDVVRAEAEFDIEGITVVAVLAQKHDDKPAFERLEVIGPERAFEPVTSTLTGRPDRGERRDRGDRGDRGPRPGADRRPRPGAERGPRPDRPDRSDRPDRPVEARDASRDRDRAPTDRPRRERPPPPPPQPQPPKPKRLSPRRAQRDE
ncbi:MAG: hypothetical protein QOI47_471, partial [Actinomycetota bacterium]|nr:hypothetical protein [Actinomycetota bacterium]